MVEGIDKLIICSPYEMPTQYYGYDTKQDQYHRLDGRRPSGYQSMNESGTYGIRKEIKSVNKIRQHVNKWRAAGYPGTTRATKTLLYYWKYRDEKQLFFCQIEAIETIIYVAEHQEEVRQIIQGDGGRFSRYCTKMATGTGKTIVMGMLIAWQVLNTGREYTKNILVVTPNLTVKDRLGVLKPGSSNNIYDEFDLVPPGPMRSALGGAHITITNFQQLKPKQQNPRSVEKLGTQGAQSFASDIVGRNVSGLLVINDEGHHAWRPSLYQNVDGKVAHSAGVWMSGLDLIHKACKILRCHDFSATPFVPTGKSSTDDTLFEWIISDFSLSDAIESGLVKTPRTPLDGDKFYHLYQNDEVRKALSEQGADELPELVVDAYKMLGQEWKKTHTRWQDDKKRTPPVMITVCNSTRHAKLVVEQFRKNTLGLREPLVSPESLLHIDSEAIKAIETDEGEKSIRHKVSTVGKAGQPGEKVCNIVSVDMLTEGWDAKTVTHVMGLRAFKSQLLCEQVVGRGLRRSSYDLNDKGMFDVEYVDIIGVPFAGILSETDSESTTKSETTSHEIVTDKPEHLVAWPMVTDVYETLIYHADIRWENIQPPQFDWTSSPSVPLGPVIDGWVAEHDKTIRREDRKQTAMYTILQNIMHNYRRLKDESISEYSAYNNSPQQTAVDVLEIIKQYVKKFVDIVDANEKTRMNILYNYRSYIARHIFENLVTPNPSRKPEAIVTGTGSTAISSKYTTKKRRFNPKKTHLNIMTADSDLELEIGMVLDKDRRVQSWAKADMAGFFVPYTHPDGMKRSYRPDFIAHLNTGVQVVIEGKGKEDKVDESKKKAIEQWVMAINRNGKYGIWDSATIYGGHDIRASLDDIIKKNPEREYTQTCARCGITTETLVKAVQTFGLEKIQGILKVCQLCIKCQDH